jgi:hypothetical protein
VTITLDLPQDLVRNLSAEAEQLGVSLAEYALQVLSGARATENLPSSGSELVAYWQREGLIGYRPRYHR